MANAAMPQQDGLGRQLRPVHAVAGVCLAAAYVIGGPHSLGVAATLALLEVMLSADSVLLNAAFLAGLGRFWQRTFLTVGLLVTTVVMRFAVPLAVVCASAGISPTTAVRLLSADPEQYRLLLAAVQPYIGAFVGIFLLTVFLEFVFGYHDVLRARGFGPQLRWRIGARTGLLGALRRILKKIPLIAELIALAVAIVAAATVPPDLAYKVLGAAVAGLATRYAVRRITWRVHFRAEGRRLNPPTPATRRSGLPMTGRSAFGLVCYLELFNAVASIDSALTAFSLTLNAALICLGLLIGASYARSIGVYLARSSRGDALNGVRNSPYGKAEGALAYLGYGRYQSVGLISALMLVTVWRDVPGGLVQAAGIAVILLAAASSIGARQVEARKLHKEQMRLGRVFKSELTGDVAGHGLIAAACRRMCISEVSGR